MTIAAKSNRTERADIRRISIPRTICPICDILAGFVTLSTGLRRANGFTAFVVVLLLLLGLTSYH